MITIKTQIAFLHLLICSGCKINKEKSERLLMDNQSQGSMQVSSAWRQFNSQDSSYRYWYYTVDSSFYFHPDGGLWGQSGTVQYMEQKQSGTDHINYRNAYDSIGILKNKEESDKHSSRTRSPLVHGLWLLLIPLVVAAYFYWKR